MSSPPLSSRDRLRQQWLQQAESVFDLMFDPDQQDQLVTFNQREHRACTLTRELAVWLLEQHLAEDPAVALPDSPPPACPRCGRPASRRTPAGDPLHPEDLLPEARTSGPPAPHTWSAQVTVSDSRSERQSLFNSHRPRRWISEGFRLLQFFGLFSY